jgi:hypothetical protein
MPVEALDDFRLMLREQLADDHERLREIEAGFDPTDPDAVRARIDLVWELAAQVGGVY